jgi:hypothetical protein
LLKFAASIALVALEHPFSAGSSPFLTRNSIAGLIVSQFVAFAYLLKTLSKELQIKKKNMSRTSENLFS